MMKFGTLPDCGAGALKSVGFEDAGEPSRLRSGTLRGAAGGPKLAGGADGPGAGLGLAGFLCFLCFLWCGLPLVVELVWRVPASRLDWLCEFGLLPPFAAVLVWAGAEGCVVCAGAFGGQCSRGSIGWCGSIGWQVSA